MTFSSSGNATSSSFPSSPSYSRDQGHDFLAAAVVRHDVLGRAHDVPGSDRSLLMALRLARDLGLAFISSVEMICSFLVYLMC
jgi:hypothetical protein